MTADNSPVIRVESDGPVRIVTLNRPETMNAFDREMQAELPRVLTGLSQDREARAVVLTGPSDSTRMTGLWSAVTGDSLSYADFIIDK